MTHFPDDEHFGGKFDLRLWMRIARHALPYKAQIIGLTTAGLTVAMVDAALPIAVGNMIDEAATNGLTLRLKLWIAGYGLLFVVMASMVWTFIRLAGLTATGIAYDLRKSGFAQLQSLSFSYFDVRPVGWLVTRLTSDVSKISNMIPWFSLDLVWGSSLMVGIITAMFFLNAKLAVVVLLIVPPLVIASVLFQKRLLLSSREVRKTNSQITASFNESISGVRTTKVLVRERENLGEFSQLSGVMFACSMRNSLQSAVYLPVVISLGSLGVGIAIWRGGLLLGSESLSLGTLVAFMQYATLMSMPIQELARRFTELQSAQAAAERIQGLLETEPEVRDDPELLAAIEAGEREWRGGPIFGADDRISTIEFRDVTFSYGDEVVLDSFDLRVAAGETIALVGPTGGGKSTIVSLVARFYEATTGAVLINGVDSRAQTLHWLQSRLGVVLQSPHLFSGSVRENIRYGRLDATDEQVEQAARIVSAHGFISELRGADDSDAGYAFDVGEGGTRLSTGQRQLVSLARVVLADPEIVILDEATSSVDTETELLIQHAVERTLAGRIAFVIAHRLSTIRSAERIVVIEDGRIAETGSHESLLKQGGHYASLYRQQFADESLLGV